MHKKIIICLLALFLSLCLVFFFLKEKIQSTSNTLPANITFLQYGEKINDSYSERSLGEKLGQNLIVGIPDTEIDEEVRELLRYIKPSGIVLYSRNFSSFSQLKELISKLQRISKEDTGFPYFIMLDEEPEGALRIGLLKNIFSLDMPQWKKIERDISILANLGINVELAPLCDFPFDNNAFVARRIPVKSVDDLMAFNKTFIKLLKDYKISATLKHFPGMGTFIEDPHKKFLESKIKEEIIEKSKEIFKAGIINGADFVMTCHAKYENIDSKNPATFSKKIVNNILKGELDFKGIILTDDLSDMPLSVKNIDLTDASIRALKAGHNLIMFSHNLPNTKVVFDKILAKVYSDKELKLIIEENYLKITNLKFNNLQ